MKKVIFLTLFVLVFAIQGFAQSLEDDYDRREGAIDPFESEDKSTQNERIEQIISRINRGDQTVLRLVTFDTFQLVHSRLLAKAKAAGGSAKYYHIAGNRRALSAYIGGFDNQDPKIRLKCIGYLGDWVDEVGKDLGLIEKEVDKRLSSNIETRKEVRYGYRVLKMKIVRRKVITSLKKGNENVLVKITPEEFLPLVFYEPRIKTIYLGSSKSVRIRSIVLDPGVKPDDGQLIAPSPGRQEGLDIERVCYNSVTLSKVGDLGEVAQWIQDAGGNPQDVVNTMSTVKTTKGLDWNCVRAIYSGIDNKSLFVREHSIRIFLNYVKGFTGDPNYNGTGTRKLSKELEKMATGPRYVRIAQVAWDNVKWAEFYYSDFVGDNLGDFIRHRHYMEYDKKYDITKRYFTDSVKDGYPEWGTEVSGNYRNDVKEVNRILGLSWYLDAEYVRIQRQQQEAKVVGKSRVETLFDSPTREDSIEGELK